MNITRAAKVGGVLIVMVWLGVLGYRVSIRDEPAPGYIVWVHVPDAIGLRPKSGVMMSNIQVGTVDKIYLDAGHARVNIRMHPEAKLFKDAAVGKHDGGLTGETFIVLLPGTEGQVRLVDGDQIKYYFEPSAMDSPQGAPR